jgi:hypothetical protein
MRDRGLFLAKLGYIRIVPPMLWLATWCAFSVAFGFRKILGRRGVRVVAVQDGFLSIEESVTDFLLQGLASYRKLPFGISAWHFLAPRSGPIQVSNFKHELRLCRRPGEDLRWEHETF